MNVEDYEGRLDALTTRLEDLEAKSGSSANLTVMKVDIATLTAKVEELKSIDITSLWG